MTQQYSPYDELTPDELREQHEEMLRLQKQDLEAGHVEGAKEMARERELLFKTAQSRGIDL